jgi:hypothetical protein
MRDPDRSTRVDVRLRRALEAGTLPRELLLVGPAGTGKTFSILSTLHCLAADYPNLRILIARQTRASITESVCVTLEQEIFPLDGMENLSRGASRRNRSSYLYPNGSEIVLGGLDNPTRITSTAWDFAFVNETIELEEDGWETVGSRLNRPGRPTWAGYFLGDTNPGDPSHWLKKRIDEGKTPCWETTHEANPGLHDGIDWTPSGVLYRERLDRLKGTRRKRYRDGIWAAGEGQWFDQFGDQGVSVEAAFSRAYPVHLSVDSGVHTGAVWFQVRGEGEDATITVFGDYYRFNASAYDNAAAILKKTQELCGGRWDRGVTDPAYQAATAVGPTVKAEYDRAGLKLDAWPSFPGSVNDGLSLVDSFVSTCPTRLLVHPDCQHLIDAFANYKRARRRKQWIDRPEDPQHPYEDVMDALRGGLQDKFPEGRKLAPKLARVQARKLF